ncbi:hypothetical protein FBQ97_21440, partial [Acidobacteria bacterium ACD]
RGPTGRFNAPDLLSGSAGDAESWNRYTYARNNPLKYVDPDGREIYAAVQHVGNIPFRGSAYHVAIVIVPRDQNRWAGHKPFTMGNERKYGTLGAGPSGVPPFLGRLESNENRKRDANPSPDVKVEWAEVDLKGRDENEVIEDLLAADRGYQDNLNYDLFPKLGTDGYNSNSYASGLLLAVGVMPPLMSVAVPGYDKPVPASAFGSTSLSSEEDRLRALGLKKGRNGIEPIQ